MRVRASACGAQSCAQAKLYLDALVIQQGRLVEKHANASSDELLQMVKFGADTIFQVRHSTRARALPLFLSLYLSF